MSDHIFAENDNEDRVYRSPNPQLSVNKPITPEHPYFDFELQIPLDTSVDFTSYYTTIENHLHFDLTVLYSLDIAKCIKPNSKLPEEEPTIDDAAKTEEGLWDSYTRVGQPSSLHHTGGVA
jgi:hypothetical protein